MSGERLTWDWDAGSEYEVGTHEQAVRSARADLTEARYPERIEEAHLASESIEHLIKRVEAADAELRTLREGIRAALDNDDLTHWVGEPDGWMVSSKAIRALLAPSDASNGA